jgi:N-acetylneuraminate synthase
MIDKCKVDFIAEIGVNHNGSLETAFELIDKLAEINADYAKFQIFKTENFVSHLAPQAQYQKANTKLDQSQFDLLKGLEFSYDEHFQVFEYCKKMGIKYLASAFDTESLSFLSEIKMDKIKIASGEITNGPFLLDHARNFNEIILSTGMADTKNIEQALAVLAFGKLYPNKIPTSKQISELALSKEVSEVLASKITILHCTSDYPPDDKDLNLLCIPKLREHFGLSVGYSDHTTRILTSQLAISFGATVIEKHVTLNKSMIGPDHAASSSIEDFNELIHSSKFIVSALGNGKKICTAKELANKEIVRKSLCASKKIKHGDMFTNENITSLRPGSGISPMNYWNYLGKQAIKSYEAGELIDQ